MTGMLGLKEIARRMGRHPKTVTRMIARGNGPPHTRYYDRARFEFDEAEFTAWMNGRKSK